MNELFDNYRVLVCAGSGGVGKTTISAALAVSAAQNGKRVLVLTIDPAKRLASALGLNGARGSLGKVPGQNFSGELYAEMIDADQIFEEFIRSSLNSEEQIQRLLKNQLYKQLSTTLSGSQEFTSLAKLATEADSGRYDLVILDTPPTQHAIDFLSAPEKIHSLFQDSITKWFIEDDAKPGFFKKIIHRGTRSVFLALEKLTGAKFMRELSDFFECVKGIQKPISEKSIRAQNLLLHEKTGFVLVTGFDEVKLREAQYFNEELERGGFNLAAVIVNRCFPFWLEKKDETEGSELAGLRDKFMRYHSNRLQSYSEFEKPIHEKVPVVRLPDLNKDISGLKGLDELGQELARRFS